MLQEQPSVVPVVVNGSALRVGHHAAEAVERHLGRRLTPEEADAYGRAFAKLAVSASVIVGLSRG